MFTQKQRQNIKVSQVIKHITTFLRRVKNESYAKTNK